MAEEGSQDDSDPHRRIEYHLIKSNHFRVVHVDGGIGGLTGRGYCHIALYNERAAIPKLRVQDIIGEKELGEERTEKVLGEPNFGVVREVEVDLLMDEKTLRQLSNWFLRRLKDFEDLRKGQKGAETENE